MRKTRRFRTGALLWSLVLTSCLSASAGTFTDTVGEQAGTNDSEADITGVQVSSDATNLYFNITLSGDISVANFGNYLIGLQTGPGGNTALNTPWGKPVGISTGMNYWIGSWVNFGGGAQLYQWDGSNWNQIGGTLTTALTPHSTTITVPSTSLSLNTGDKFKFDVWSTYGSPGGQSAYDALDNPHTTVADPWNGTPYDSAAAGALATDGVFNVPGDTNNDGKVNFTDLLTLAQNYGSTTASWPQGDFNADSSVTFEDLLALAQHYGSDVTGGAAVVAVPEPVAICCLLPLGCATLLRWRRSFR